MASQRQVADLRLPFQAERSGQGPQTWGQIQLWDVFQWLPAGDTSLNLMRDCAVPAGCEFSDVLDGLRVLTERHDSLRTVFSQDGETPIQTVHADGEVVVTVWDIGTCDAATAVQELGPELRAVPFDIGRDYPVRVAVLLSAGEPVRLLLVGSHMALDGWSFRIVLRELALALAGEPLPPVSQQPLDRAQYEASARGQRREATSLAFWERQVERAPAAMLTSVRGSDPPDFRWGVIESPALARAARILGATTDVAPNQILLAATALLLAAHTGESEAVLRLIVSTRFQSENRELVGSFNQNAVFSVPIDYDSTFDVFLKAVATAALRCYWHSECHPRKLEAMVARVAERRGIVPDGYCFFNYVRFNDPKRLDEFAPVEPDDADHVEELLSQTTVRSVDLGMTPKGATFFLFLTAVDASARINLGIDRRFLAGLTPEAFLSDLERIVVSAAAQGHTLAELRATLGQGSDIT